MRNFNDIYNDKVNESIIHNENRIIEEYTKIMEALMVDNGIVNFEDDEATKSFNAQLSECFDATIGITEKGHSYLKNRELFLTESSTTIEKREFLKRKISKVLESAMYTQSLKNGIYAAIDDVYVGVKATKLSEALTMEEIEECICESITNHVKNSLIKEIKNEVITD